MKRVVAALVIAASVAPLPALAQGSDAGNGTRFGVSFGGVSTVALNVEFFRDGRSLDVVLGTWTFHEVSASVVAKQYIGGSAVRPVAGLGLWFVGAPPTSEGERSGMALVLRAPVGLDWEFVDQHALGAFLDFSKALWVRRPDPADDKPLIGRIAPLPEVYYRYRR